MSAGFKLIPYLANSADTAHTPQNAASDQGRSTLFANHPLILDTSRKHAYIMLTPLNPTFM